MTRWPATFRIVLIASERVRRERETDVCLRRSERRGQFTGLAILPVDRADSLALRPSLSPEPGS